MKTIVTVFRNKRVEVSYQDTNRGITLSQIDWSGKNIVDEITTAERNLLIIELLTKN
jgi:hypothetical protein